MHIKVQLLADFLDLHNCNKYVTNIIHYININVLSQSKNILLNLIWAWNLVLSWHETNLFHQPWSCWCSYSHVHVHVPVYAQHNYYQLGMHMINVCYALYISVSDAVSSHFTDATKFLGNSYDNEGIGN